MNKIIAFLPMRKGSQRVKNKNTRKFANYKFGLFELKLEQLLKSNVDEILISTNDEIILNFLEKQKNNRIKIDRRPEWLCSNESKTDDLISYVAQITEKKEDILWTHVTSPFIDENDYNKAIEIYHSQINKYDSLMSVTKLHTFLWDRSGPINYDRSLFKWPWTQTLPEIFEVNSGIFIAKSDIYKTKKDRIGDRPYFFELEGYNGFDIDWEKDFDLAEHIFLTGK